MAAIMLDDKDAHQEAGGHGASARAIQVDTSMTAYLAAQVAKKPPN